MQKIETNKQGKRKKETETHAHTNKVEMEQDLYIHDIFNFGDTADTIIMSPSTVYKSPIYK